MSVDPANYIDVYLSSYKFFRIEEILKVVRFELF